MRKEGRLTKEKRKNAKKEGIVEETEEAEKAEEGEGIKKKENWKRQIERK